VVPAMLASVLLYNRSFDFSVVSTDCQLLTTRTVVL